MLKQNYPFWHKPKLNLIPEPGDPGSDYQGGGSPGGTGGGSTVVNNLGFFAKKRYTCNLLVSEELKVVDLLHDVIYIGSRMFLTQGSNGKLKLNSKRPVSWGLGTAAFAIGDISLAIDNISEWVGDLSGYLLIDPYTINSEIRQVIDANYASSQNSITLSASANMTVAGFAGCDGNNTPASASVTVNSVNSGVASTITLDGITITFTGGSGDSTSTMAQAGGYSINAHPKLRQRFFATIAANIITVKARFGTLVVDSGLSLAHAAPISSPAAAPTLAASSGGSLLAGTYKVAYSYLGPRGQTRLSPVASVTVTAGQKIDVTAISPPAGASVNWYVTVGPSAQYIRKYINNNGAGFSITAPPLLVAQLPPDLNRTGAEVLRIRASFSDRPETRSNRTASNVLKATYNWLLGNREKTVNRIDLKYRNSFDDYRLVELRLRDDAHIAKTKKISNLEIDGQSIDNYYQAYRIANGLLAEYRDADFFYEWSSTREALLLEEGDVVAVTDNSSGVINLPIFLEAVELDISSAGLPKAAFTGQKYSSTLYDDSMVEKIIPIVIEP